MSVPLDKLIPADQETLKKHFAQKVETTKRAAPENLAHPLGQAVGPIKTNKGSYFLYMPKSLVKDRLAPVMFFTGAGGAKKNIAQRYVEGAEVNGWIIALSVESRNGRDNRADVKSCIAHIKETLPVDPKRFYFTGSSGGGVHAMINTEVYDGAGAMPFIAHSGIDKMPSKKAHYYFVNGATDFNRYASAFMRKNYKDHAFQRFNSGGHTNGPNSIAHDGMAWLNGHYLAERKSDQAFADERLDYERRMLDWAKELKKKTPYRAFLQLDFLINDYKISGQNAAEANQLAKELSADQNNVKYVEGLKEIDEFAQREFPEFGNKSQHKHTNNSIKSGAAKLEEKYKGVPELPEILKSLQKPTI